MNKKENFITPKDLKTKQHSKHYQGDIETIDFMKDKMTKEQFEGYVLCNIIKYASRVGKKEGQTEKDKFKILDYASYLVNGKWFNEMMEAK